MEEQFNIDEKEIFVRSLHCERCYANNEPTNDNIFLFYKKGKYSIYKPGSFYVQKEYCKAGITSHLIEVDKYENGRVFYYSTCLNDSCGIEIVNFSDDNKELVATLEQIRNILVYGLNNLNSKVDSLGLNLGGEHYFRKILQTETVDMSDALSELRTFLKPSFTFIRRVPMDASFTDFNSLKFKLKEKPLIFKKPTLV